MMMKKYDEIEKYLDEIIPNPKCELDYFNDYSLLISIMLSAQTTDKRVNEVTKVLFDKYESLEELKNASYNDLKEIIKPLGNYTRKAFNVKEIARILHDNYEGKVPSNREVLETLPGVGRKTANVFLAEFLSVPAIAVDTHVERVTKRLKLVKSEANVLIIEKALMSNIQESLWGKRHLQLVLFGRYFCKAKNPLCKDCKLQKLCGYFQEEKEKSTKKKKVTKVIS